jgi:hypothetical protein
MSTFANMQSPANQSEIVRNMVERWNAGDLKITDEQANKLARLAAEYGYDFDSESNPLGKGLFDFADTTLLGLLPNDWRPTTVGEEWHGESFGDRAAGTVGTVGGLFTGLGLIMFGGWRGASSADDVMTATANAKTAMARQRANQIATTRVTDPRRMLQGPRPGYYQGRDYQTYFDPAGPPENLYWG